MTPPTNSDSNWALILVALAASRLIELLVTSAYKTLSGNRYVTKKDCEKCQSSEHGVVKEFKEDMKLMRGILLVVAVKVGVPESEWKRLAG
jgi:hypothetical protein